MKKLTLVALTVSALALNLSAKEVLTEKRKSKIYKFKPVRNITGGR